ncbi:MAG: cation:proton antiporter [Candidatus Magasanikbacteria bacterium]|nr:cation:proton antiporter [Candidatus Magasanikbacteria bacterium]
MTENIFFQISIIFGITVSIAFVMRLLRQPLIVAYIIAGLAAGPLFLNLVNDSGEFFSTFAQFGIVLLLFIVGLSLNFDYIRRLGRTVVIGTLWQFAVTVVLGFILMYFFGFGGISSLFLSVAVSFSSTIIVTKLLADKKDLETVYGRFIVGVLLVQDVIAVLLMVFLNTWTNAEKPWYEVLATTGGSGLLLVGLVFLLARYLLPKLMDRVAKSGELLFIFTVAWCFGVASLVYWAGFSIEIGAIIAGISLGASPYQPEISSRMRPLRDFFIVLFFIVLGSELSIGDMRGAVVPAVALSLLVIVADPIVLYLAMRCLNHTRRSSLLAGITSAQVSEFGFILVFTGMELGYLRGQELAILTLTALITIVVSSYLISYSDQIYSRFLPLLNKLGKDRAQLENEAKEIYDVWVFGYHRMGWKVCEALAEKKVRYAVVDYNPAAIAKLKHRGIPAYFGDAADVEFLSVLSLEKAKLIISTIPEADDQKAMIQYVRKLSDKPIIIASLFHSFYLEDLYEAGANYVMMPHLLGGQWMSEILRGKPWSRETFKKLRQEQREELKLRYTVGAH